jgi:hypothetical protein
MIHTPAAPRSEPSRRGSESCRKPAAGCSARPGACRSRYSRGSPLPRRVRGDAPRTARRASRPRCAEMVDRSDPRCASSPAATRVAVQFDGMSAINPATTRVLIARDRYSRFHLGAHAITRRRQCPSHTAPLKMLCAETEVIGVAITWIPGSFGGHGTEPTPNMPRRQRRACGIRRSKLLRSDL